LRYTQELREKFPGGGNRKKRPKNSTIKPLPGGRRRTTKKNTKK